MKQLDLAPAPDLPPPDASAPKLWHMSDPALGVAYTIAFGAASPWFELFPPQQHCTVIRHAAGQQPAA